MNSVTEKLRAMGLTDTQIATVLSGWSLGAIEALLRGERQPPSAEGIASAVLMYGAD